MNKKQVSQMNTSLLRRLTTQPSVRYLGSHRDMLAALLKDGSYLQKFAPLLEGADRIRCGDVLALCQEDLGQLSPEPEEGWIKFTYAFACKCMFPEDSFLPRQEKHGAGATFFLGLLQVFFDMERTKKPADPMWDLALLGPEELEGSAHKESYSQFLRCYRREYVYEMMRLGLEATPYRTLEHIAGVHHVAISVARDLKRAGVGVDLALVSASAAGHDVGKFGCRPGERVPYLHYYYTDQWFRRRHMEDVGYVAANHSVWDLELDYLSVESLCLIYADFRVKQERGPDGREITKVSSLAEAFQVILSKLDNVDSAKQIRYTFVYTKLRDFERYMVGMGVDVKLQGEFSGAAKREDPALMDEGDAIGFLHLLGTEHNIELMGRLTGQRSFANLLEQARSETDWRRLRAYLGIFESYSVYLSASQKIQTLAFLYELLMHREGDIRDQAGALIGEIIARFQAGYVKERPTDAPPDSRNTADLEQWRLYLEMIIYPDHKLISQHRRWISFSLKTVVNSLLEKCDPARKELFLKAFLRYYRRGAELEDETAFQLLETATALPLNILTPRQRHDLLEFARSFAQRKDLTVRIAAVLLIEYMGGSIVGDSPIERASLMGELLAVPCSESRPLARLREAAAAELGGAQVPLLLSEDEISEIFLDNLKSATPWIVKKVNIRLLRDATRGGGSQMLHIATHLTNLVKVSDQVVVRHAAGAALLDMAERLSIDQRNEVSVELVRGLEIDQQEFSKYIPDYLGQLSLWLPPIQLEETLGALWGYLCSSNSRVVAAALDTVGVIYESYDSYRARFPEKPGAYRERRERLLGMLMKGLASFKSEVHQEALFVLGNRVFGSYALVGHEKKKALQLTMKKILTLIGDDHGTELTFYYRAAMLGKLYRFITEQEILHGGFRFAEPRPIAFFPGTFDPFTLSHKGIVRAIRDLGYEVLLAIDEFSWSKKTQPHRIRRQIANMSVADEFHVYLFPENFPVNIANPTDLENLRRAFPGRNVAIVAGSDVLANASSYKAPPQPYSIHTFDHVVFRRAEPSGEAAGSDAVTEAVTEVVADYSAISGQVVELQLPPHLEEISSTRIREAIDQGRDISNLVDPIAQEFIYLHGLYLREPQDKPFLIETGANFRHDLTLTDAGVTFRRDENLPDEDERRMIADLLQDMGGEMLRELQRTGDQVCLMCRGSTVLGFTSYCLLEPPQLFSRLGSSAFSGLVRKKAWGRVLLISGIHAARGPEQLDVCQLLLSEVLTIALREAFGYAIFCSLTDHTIPSYTREVLTLQGFMPISVPGEKREILAVDMRQPVVLTRNVDTTIKAPLATNPKIVSAISNAHRRLQRAVTDMYPGNLVLSISAEVLYQRLLRRIAACNRVSVEPVYPRQLGACICVPFGKILRGVAVPNTVTKTLHTDKVYQRDLSYSSIEAYPYYSPLEDQVRVIRSFNRPVILVDDMLHDGKRISRVAPLLRACGADIRQVLVGYLTGMGKDLMEQMNCPVDSIYYLPNLRKRFVESTLYPFIGGDTILRDTPMAGGLHAAVNRIFPYAAPEMTDDCADGSIYRLSLCCLENARDILLTLETEYRALYARNLTLSHLGEAVVLPLCPDKGSCMAYDLNRAASTYLDNDIEMLRRLQSNIRIVIGNHDNTAT